MVQYKDPTAHHLPGKKFFGLTSATVSISIHSFPIQCQGGEQQIPSTLGFRGAQWKPFTLLVSKHMHSYTGRPKGEFFLSLKIHFHFRVALNLDLWLQTLWMQPDLHLAYPVDFYRAKQRWNTALLHTQMLLSLQKKGTLLQWDWCSASPPGTELSASSLLGCNTGTRSQLNLNRCLLKYR